MGLATGPPSPGLLSLAQTRHTRAVGRGTAVLGVAGPASAPRSPPQLSGHPVPVHPWVPLGTATLSPPRVCFGTRTSITLDRRDHCRHCKAKLPSKSLPPLSLSLSFAHFLSAKCNSLISVVRGCFQRSSAGARFNNLRDDLFL